MEKSKKLNDKKQCDIHGVMGSASRLPKSFSEFDGEIMSNFYRQIDLKVVEEIKGKDLFSGYSGWNFYGKIWWQNDKWACEVWCYESFRETFICDTLEEIMEEVSSEYGNE